MLIERVDNTAQEEADSFLLLKKEPSTYNS